MDFLLIIIVIICALVYFLYKHLTTRNLKEKIKYCTTDTNSIYYLNSLYPESCYIKSNEESFAKEILSDFKRELSEAYFQGHLTESFLIEFDDHEFFVHCLNEYLLAHDCDIELGNKEKYVYISQKSYYNTRDREVYYALTDLGLVYQKLLYITLLHCTKNPKLKKHRKFFNNEIDVAKKAIDTKKFEIYHYT